MRPFCHLLSMLVCLTLLVSSAPAQKTEEPDDTNTISLNIPNVDIREALRMVARLTGQNLVIDDDVRGVINIFLEDITPEEAWKVVLGTNDLGSSREGNLVYVFPLDQETRNQQNRETRIIKMRYITLGVLDVGAGGEGSREGSSQSGGATPQDLQGQTGSLREGQQTEGPSTTSNIDTILKTAFGEALTVSKDARTNQLILTGMPSTLDAAEKVIEALDQPVAQILIEAQIILARTTALEEIGVDWGGVYTFSNTGTAGVSGQRTTNMGDVSGESEQSSWNFTTSLGSFNVAVSALVESGDARILSRPRIMTQNQREALISSGQEIQVPSGLDVNGNASFREREVVLELGVTPSVLNDSMIDMLIRIANDSIDFSQDLISGVPPLNINQVRSSVILRDSETVVIGGIVTQQEDFSKTRVPGISSVPLLGLFFKQDNNRAESSELLVAISPRIVSDADGRIVPTVDLTLPEENAPIIIEPNEDPTAKRSFSNSRAGWNRFQGRPSGKQ